MKSMYLYNIPPSIYNAFLLCERQAWLMLRRLSADNSNTYLEIGRLIDEESFKRYRHRIDIPGLSCKLDFIMKKDNTLLVAEVKKSSKTIETAIKQLKYYLYLLYKKGIKAKGVLKIPTERKSISVNIGSDDIDFIEETLKALKKLYFQENPPILEKKIFCSKCGHFEFCWS